jgi:tetratricopeptide (TPR) repeat protein
MGFSNTHLDSLFITANQDYQTEKYVEAIDNYQTILDSNYYSFELYFNLANANYQFGKIPLSIYYYEKALQIKKDKDALNNLALAQNRITLIEPIPQLFYIRWWNNITHQLSQKMWSVLLITGIWLSSVLLILFIKNRKKWKFNGLLLSIIITFLIGGQLYNANIQENKVYGIILKEAKLFDDNINYQSSGNVDRGNKVLILNESENMFLINLLDGQSGWVEKNRIKTLEIY